jgi:CrcB protein
MPSSEPRLELVTSSKSGIDGSIIRCQHAKAAVGRGGYRILLRMIWLAVAVGGALGSMARHAVNMFFAHVLGRAVPYATAAVNLAGSATIGVLAALVATGRVHMSTELRTFVFVGILGGFTTFSSFMLDTFTLGHGGEHGLAFANVAMQTAFGLLAVWAGFRLGHAIG